MRLIGLAAVLAVSLLLAPHDAETQQAGRVWRMGYLIEGPRPTGRPIPAFLDALRELGYIEGQNLIIDYRDGQSDRLPELAVGLVRSKLDLIAAVGTQEVLALKGATVSEGELLRK